MKHYFVYIIPMLALLTACNELDKAPKDAVNSEVYFQNESQLEQYSNQFYTLFPSAASMYNEASDEIAIAELADEIRGTRIVPTDNSGTNWNWTMLRHINYLIEHANQCPDEDVANEYIALARFFRAYLYYDRVRHYGDVPWIDRTLGNDDEALYQPRDDRKFVMRNVMSDLDSAFKYLPKTADRIADVYHVNAYTALAMKSRIALFEGTWHRYHSDASCKAFADSMLTVAWKAAEQVIDANIYQLYQEGDNSQAYRHLFTMGNVQGCSEYILARHYDKALNQYHNLNNFTLSPTTGKPGFTKRFVNKYLMTDGSRFTDEAKRPNWRTMALGQEMNNRDPRMEQTIFRPGHYVRIGGDTIEEYLVTTSATGYQLIKYVVDKSKDTYNQSDCDMPIIRLAEVYLNYAEAKAELEDFSDADAAKSINKLRQRANMPDMDVAGAQGNPCPYMESLYPHVNQNNKGIILEIRRERDIELVQEGFRYWDIMRWKEGQSFEQPYLGISFAGVSKNDEDESGFIKLDEVGWNEACAWRIDKPFYPWVQYLQVNKDIVLTDSVNGGNILSNGVQGNLNNGRKWNEDRDYLYPIPIREITLTNGAITQNPGW